MYNTYDVHHYAGFALLMLWPLIELSLQRDFAQAVSSEDLTERLMLGSGEKRPRKVAGAVPHDMGSPSESPWIRTNIYNFQDVSRWKDLGPKFALQVYRDYLYTGQEGRRFLQDVYTAALSTMSLSLSFDSDNDGMIENQGFPDQTYDIWTATGVHAYCGGLWVAACYAMSTMAQIMNDTLTQEKFLSLALKATVVYNNELWNETGGYFNLDNSVSYQHNSVMADMLQGHFFALVCRLPGVSSPSRAYQSYQKIFAQNVIAFGGGRVVEWENIRIEGGRLIGAVNGTRPDSSSSSSVSLIDNTCLQSREVWTGTTYTLAGGMIIEACREREKEEKEREEAADNHERKSEMLSERERENLIKMAMMTAQGIHDGGWQEFGYWFATPEAWEQSGNYRSLGYMRPLSIWSIQFALEIWRERERKRERKDEKLSENEKGNDNNKYG